MNGTINTGPAKPRLRQPCPWHFRLLGGVSLLGFLAGCSDAPTGLVRDTERAPSIGVQLTRTVEDEQIDRFTLSIRASGAFRPGQPITVTVDARANLGTEGAVLRIAFPEIQLAQLTSWGDGFSYEVDRALPPAREIPRVDLPIGGSVGETVVVTPLASGYYRIVATARSVAPVQLALGGRWIQNVAVAEAWLLVTEAGGEVTTAFDRSRIPAGYRQQPGPFRRESGRSGGEVGRPTWNRERLPPATGPSVANAPMRSGTPDAVTFRAIYWDADSSAYRPVASARFQLDGCTVPEGQFICNNEDWEQITWGYTDPSGYYYLLGCGQGVEEYWSMVWTHAGGDNFQVYGGYAQQWGLVAADCGNSYDMVVPSNPARVFLNLRKTVEGSAALFGVSRPFINVNVASCGSSFYSPTNDEITICTGHVWGEWGTFITAHEYGHAFHETALWGNTGSACNPHYIDAESTLACAFSEGFADYFGSAVRPDLATYEYRGRFEADSYFPGCVERAPAYPYPCIGGTSYEGSVIEGAFAGFLYDLTDAVVEPHDSIAAPGAYVRDLIRTCQVLYPSAWWRRANGADEIAYCAENAINPGTYFTRRGQPPVAYSESATEAGGWTSARVHRNWTWNMYEKP